METEELTVDNALEYHQKGFSVFPLIPHSKQPLVNSWQMYRKERPDIRQIRQWFSDGGNSNNIAIVTGKVSAVFAFDIDGKDAKEYFNKIIERLEDEVINNAIKKTFSIKTGGDNINIVIGFKPEEFLDGEEIRNCVLWHGQNVHVEIRLKGEGSYILAPPSTHPNGNKYIKIKETRPVILAKERILRLITSLTILRKRS